MNTVLATGADERYGYWLLNLLGSINTNSRGTFDRVVAFDLGLSPLQRRLLHGLRGVEVRDVPPFVPHWREGFTWKPWIWTHLDADAVFWVDAGSTILRPLDGVLEQIERRGYFVVSQGWETKELIPSDYYALYDLSPAAVVERICVAAGIIGFCRDSEFYDRVIVPTYEDCLEGRSLGFSAHEAESMNSGLNRAATVIVRDCSTFRHDQSILNIRLLQALPDATVADIDQYAGWRSPHQHAEQLIWSHRKRGRLTYLWRLPYSWPTLAIGFPVGVYRSLRLWVLQNLWAVRPTTYTRKLRTLLRGLLGTS